MKRHLRVVAGLLFAVVPLIVYLFYTGLLESDLIVPVVTIVLSAALLVYFGFGHEFKESGYQRITIFGGLSSLFIGSFVWLVLEFLTESVDVIPSSERPLPVVPESFLPEWWLLIFLAPAAIALAVSSLRVREQIEYATPENVESLPQSPVFFGGVVGFIGFWGVLFVGLGIIHRIVIVAPIFEELLKFGVALMFATAVFGRSLLARYAVAIIVGVVFGMVEHTLTYPAEADLIYLFRVVFHFVTTGLSILIYSIFEERGENRSMWVAPALSILFHFSHNTFIVLSAVVLLESTEATLSTVQFAFGTIVIICTLTATLLTLRRSELVFEFHRVITSFLPDHEV